MIFPERNEFFKLGNDCLPALHLGRRQADKFGRPPFYPQWPQSSTTRPCCTSLSMPTLISTLVCPLSSASCCFSAFTRRSLLENFEVDDPVNTDGRVIGVLSLPRPSDSSLKQFEQRSKCFFLFCSRFFGCRISGEQIPIPWLVSDRMHLDGALGALGCSNGPKSGCMTAN